MYYHKKPYTIMEFHEKFVYLVPSPDSCINIQNFALPEHIQQQLYCSCKKDVSSRHGSTLSSSALQNLRVRDVNEPHYDLYIQTGLMDGVVKNDVL